MPSAIGPGEPLLPEGFRTLLRNALPGFSLDLPELQQQHLARFLAELDAWRRHVNLTGRLSCEDLVSHTLESALGASLLPGQGTVVDIGTGGGFPGVPLAILRPDLSVTWLEARERRVAFLQHVARTVPVDNAVVRAARAEDLPESGYDFATSRAVAIESLHPDRFLKPGGGLLLWTTAGGAAGAPPEGFRREGVLAIPLTRERVIALYRYG
ncbi:MAG: 16S rRNA (guanine(527)-N(7))-methyltransferase RsmG [Acidobacteriota bacterium]